MPDVVWYIDDIQLSPCISGLTPQFNAEIVSGNTFQFYDQTPGSVTAWCWDFGDGTFSELQNPQHTFAGASPYTVCLTILDGDGCKARACQTIGSPCQCGTTTLTLTADETWTSQNINLGNTLVIPPGRTLTVGASTVKVATGCGIIVQRGARLNVLEGSTLRGWCDGGLWNGVRVEGAGGSVLHPDIGAIGSNGVPGSYPTSVNQHGVVYAYGSTQSPTTIRDAEIALGNQAGSSYGNGGIIYASGVTFTENRLSGNILPYPALATPTGSAAAPNISRFTDCTFSLNLSAPPNIATARGIRITGSESILIRNCTFSGLGNDAITGTDYTATIQRCTFEGQMPVAVRVQHTPGFAQAFQFIIGGVSMSNNFLNTNTGGFFTFSTGISATGVSKLRISHNVFETQIGINLMGGASGYEITDNTFNSDVTGLYGAILNQTGGNLFNKSQCNYFGKLNLGGMAAWGNNRGYEFIQETFSSGTYYDVYVSPFFDGTQVGAMGSIFPGQGAEGDAVFNLFEDDNDILSSTNPGWTEFFWYFYPEDEAGTYPDLLPVCDLDDNCTSVVNYYLNKKTSSTFNGDGCLNLVGVGGEDNTVIITLPDGDSLRIPLTPGIPGMSTTAGDPVISALNCDTFTCLNTLYSKIDEWNGLVDGGDTGELLGAISAAPDADATMQTLLDASPYLSDEVLLAYLQNTQTSSDKKLSVSHANAPLSNAVLDTAQTEFSSQDWQGLKDLRDSLVISDREQLEILTGRLVRIKNQVLNVFGIKYFSENDSMALEDMLQDDGSEFAQRKLLGVRLHYRNFSGAESLLDSLPVNTAEAYEYHYLQQINLYRLADSTFTLSQGQEDSLYLVAGGSTLQAALAKTMLTVLTDTIFPIELPDEPVEERSGQEISWHSPSNTVEKNIILQPNPAREETTIILPETTERAILRIYASSGRLLTTVRFTGHQTRFNTGKLPSGIYIVEVFDGKRHFHSSLAIQR